MDSRRLPSAGAWRVMVALAGIALTAPASAADRLVRVFFPAYDLPVVTGGVVPVNKIHTILFIKEKCTLPIADAENMFRAWRVAGAYQVGCWYPTLNDEYVYINGIGQLFHSQGDYWSAYPHGMLHDDGSVTITEPDYDSRTFWTLMHQRITQEHLRSIVAPEKP